MSLQSKREVYGRTTNNEAYYIALVEGLKIAKKYGANDIASSPTQN
jgi:ribonuclease HI